MTRYAYWLLGMRGVAPSAAVQGVSGQDLQRPVLFPVSGLPRQRHRVVASAGHCRCSLAMVWGSYSLPHIVCLDCRQAHLCSQVAWRVEGGDACSLVAMPVCNRATTPSSRAQLGQCGLTLHFFGL